MNIFYLDTDPRVAASYHCDKHCVKMILESAQLLSTAHRVLDGVPGTKKSPSGRNLKTWILDDYRDAELYSATHVNHPCALWARQSSANYYWLESLFVNLCLEYTRRYGRVHLCESKLQDILAYSPDNIVKGDLTPPALAMPDHCKVDNDPVASYRNYYILEKSSIAVWAYSPQPDWFTKGIKCLP